MFHGIAHVTSLISQCSLLPKVLSARNYED